ncbi:uncharacterized protein LOC135850048 [Planococcus citri]|uniref:uncharacterized protein LOC135850048 n=1 Tax=Planococcus citri TaxID=170843 RepID=UPI0031F73E9A
MKDQFFTMCSISTLFTVFVSIYPFFLQLSNADMSKHEKQTAMSSRDIKPPEWMYPKMPMSEPSESKPSSLDAYLEFNPSSQFRKDCAWSYNVNSNNQECLRFCGYVKIGMMDSVANLRSSYVRNKIKLIHDVRRINEKAVYNGIMRCASRGYYDLCSKAMRNANCLFEYINSDWVDIDLIRVMGPGTSGGGSGSNYDGFPW